MTSNFAEACESNIIVMYLIGLLLLLCLATVALGLTCNPVKGDNSDCACTMDDGSGTVDISSYANKDKTAR